LDFIPTICDLVGIAAPKGLQGISLKPFLTGTGEKPTRKYIVTEDYNGVQITDGRYKYTIYELPGNPEILTDLLTNPGETINYAKDPACKEQKAKLKKELMANLSKRGLTPLPQNRTIENLRKLENEKKGKKGKGKNKEEE
jgi:arylsulfatase A-like enzyme